eukprot:gene6702-8339_t
MRSRLLLALGLTASAFLTGCATTTARVQPWERATLADYTMRPDRDPLALALTEHVAGQVGQDVDELLEQIADCTPEDPRTVELVLAMFARWLDERALVLAKVELTMEAARDPEL